MQVMGSMGIVAIMGTHPSTSTLCTHLPTHPTHPHPQALVLVFFVSAVLHELALGVPLHMYRLWAFWGIMFQVGLCGSERDTSGTHNAPPHRP